MTQEGERKLVCDGDPVWYNKTSGTVGAPKKIPYTQRTRDWFHRYGLVYQSGIGNDTQKNFFFTLVDSFEEIKEQCPQ